MSLIIDLALRNSLIAGVLFGTADPKAVLQRYPDITSGEVTELAQHIQSEAQQEAEFTGLLSLAAFAFPDIAPFISAGRVVESGRLSPEQAIGATMALFNGGFGDYWEDGGGEFPGDFGSFDPGGVFDAGGGLPDIVSDISTAGQLLRTGARLITDTGDVVSGDGGGTVPTSVGGAITGGIVSGGVWLGSYLARAFGRGAAGAIYTAANGIRVRISQLWPLVRRYGPETVASALGISLGALGTLLLQPGATGRRRRRRGISARDLATSRRTMRKLITMTHTLRQLCGSVPRTSYHPRRRRT